LTKPAKGYYFILSHLIGKEGLLLKQNKKDEKRFIGYGRLLK